MHASIRIRGERTFAPAALHCCCCCHLTYCTAWTIVALRWSEGRKLLAVGRFVVSCSGSNVMFLGQYACTYVVRCRSAMNSLLPRVQTCVLLSNKHRRDGPEPSFVLFSFTADDHSNTSLSPAFPLIDYFKQQGSISNVGRSRLWIYFLEASFHLSHIN